MRRTFFLAMAYVAGVQGFVIFAPYLVTFAAVAHVVRLRQNGKRMLAIAE